MSTESGTISATGYEHPAYAESLVEFGCPRRLPHCGASVLERQIPGFPEKDAIGPYPLFACQDWSQLSVDLDRLDGDLISLAVVTDPFGDYDEAHLLHCFRHVVVPFKEHLVVDLSMAPDAVVSKHHRYYARRALREIVVEVSHEPLRFAEEWSELYAFLVARHALIGIRAFSREAFARQLAIPGMVMFRALHGHGVVSAHLWCVQGKVGYSHLAASTLIGYELSASYALHWAAIHYFAQRLEWLDLGSGAGIEGGKSDGLTQFKQGWATGTRTAYFCGRVHNRAKYDEIAKTKGVSKTGYFPAYRDGEFT